MAETWIPWATKAPAPPEKSGYYAIPSRGLHHLLYFVGHDAQGWKSYLKQGHRPGAQASWAFSNMLDGELFQHYPLEAITWTSGTAQANISGLGVEHEGGVGSARGPITNAQVATDVRLFKGLQALCPNLRAPILGQGFEEHRRLTNGATACPSDRIRWGDIAAQLIPAFPPPVIEEDMAKLVRFKPFNGIYAVNGGRLDHLKDAVTAVAAGYDLGKTTHLEKTDADYLTLAALPVFFADMDAAEGAFNHDEIPDSV